MRYSASLLCVLLLSFGFEAYSQGLYTARGYWEESTKINYQSIKQRQNKGDSLSHNQTAYIKDYEFYLASYFQRLPDEEKQKFELMKDQWNRELSVPPPVPNGDNNNFEWRTRDRITNGFYGIYYGSSLIAIAEINEAAAAGIPLITGGLWLLGPALNPKKYEGITRNTIRANNTGRFLGLGYGAALGLALGGQATDSYKWVLGLSSVGSIALGEAAFQIQKRKNIPRGQIEMMRHYGFLFPLVAASLMAAGHVDSPNLYGLALLGGGVSGLIIGNKLSKKYDYSQGDVDAIHSLAIISAGVGFTIVAEALEKSIDPNALLLIPAATSILGTVLSQRAVKGIHLSDKQGSTISLSSTGAALIGFGIVAMAESESVVAIIGVPTGLALITHQILFHNFKMKNLEMKLRGHEKRKHDYKFSLTVTPENYLLNKKIDAKNYSPQSFSRLQNSLFNLRFTF